MKAAVSGLTAVTCMFALLMTSEFASAIAQETTRNLTRQADIMTAKASSNMQGDAYDSAINKAWNLCMLRGLYNITRIRCDCAQNDTSGAFAWECVGTAECQK
jgi:hypothetical protein